MNDDALARVAYAEGQAERANLRARQPFDLAAQLIEQSVREAARVADELRLTVIKLRTGLVEIESKFLTAGEALGAEAASKVPKVRRPKREKAEIPWCSCTMYLSPHLHRDHGVADEESP